MFVTDLGVIIGMANTTDRLATFPGWGTKWIKVNHDQALGGAHDQQTRRSHDQRGDGGIHGEVAQRQCIGKAVKVHDVVVAARGDHQDPSNLTTGHTGYPPGMTGYHLG